MLAAKSALARKERRRVWDTADVKGDVSPGHLAWSRGLSASQSAHHFMYISLGHGHLSPEDDTSQYTLHHTSSPAPNCLQEKKVVVLMELHRAIIYTTKMSKQVTESHVRDAVHMYSVN
jgi:hypothetical protein